MNKVIKAQISDQFQYRQSVLRDSGMHPVQLASPSSGSMGMKVTHQTPSVLLLMLSDKPLIARRDPTGTFC